MIEEKNSSVDKKPSLKKVKKEKTILEGENKKLF
jgi:hypothetical protein